MHTFTNRIANALNLRPAQVENTLTLFAEGATVPFISRYRKEMTGSLDEVEIMAIKTLQDKYVEVEKRRDAIVKAIEEQGKMTDELRAQIQKATELTTLEDLYLPYKRSRKTRASQAREKGLEPLATWLLEQKNGSVEVAASPYITEQVPNIAAALQGAQDIIAELVNESAEARNTMRAIFERTAVLRSKVVRGKTEEAIKYKDYHEFEENLTRCPSHRILAILRAEEEGFLRVAVAPLNETNTTDALCRLFVKARNEAAEQVTSAVLDSYKRLLEPSIETEFRNIAKERADLEAIRVFSENLRQLLLAAPLGQRRVVGIDPGFRSGCKVVCLDESGMLLHNTNIYPHAPQNNWREAEQNLEHLIQKYGATAIAVGNGTASRETEALVRGLKTERPVEVFMVSEAGASIYSASDVAREEFPDFDVTVRGAISIGRRLIDPLAELVKIDPKSIGVGQYQHDVDQKLLKGNLDAVVESCVNTVGIDLNTASKHLLTYVSGLGEKLAQNIVDYRTENGAFTTKQQIKKVARMGEKAFEQSAGFLRVRNGKNPLDNTAVHPERYELVTAMAKDLNATVSDLIQKEDLRKQISLQKYVTKDVGLPTLTDIVAELSKPGLDPRGTAQSFAFDETIRTIADVKIGMILPGIITNITKFGAFVDIGTKENGLVHISQITNRYITDPTQVLKLHAHVQVRVIEIDRERKRIQLSMKDL